MTRDPITDLLSLLLEIYLFFNIPDFGVLIVKQVVESLNPNNSFPEFHLIGALAIIAVYFIGMIDFIAKVRYYTSYNKKRNI